MKAFHVVSGLPRSGSSLLCALLNQNPDFYASPTSVVPPLVGAMSGVFSNNPEFKGMLGDNKEKALERMRGCVWDMIDSWYTDFEEKIVFDKSRGWPHQSEILLNLFPDAKIILCVRDLRNVFSSIVKQDNKEPLLNSSGDRTVYALADKLFMKDGMIGGPIDGIMDLYRRKKDNIIVVKFEELTSKPESTMLGAYEELGIDPYKHNYKKVKSSPSDTASDHLYLYKFPHLIEGKVTKQDSKEWEKFYSKEIADLIMNKFAHSYNKVFGYE